MKVSSFTLAQDAIDEITLLIERNQSKCSTLKHKLTTMLTSSHENETFKITNQFLFDLSFDLRTVLTMLDRLKVQNNHINAELRSADATIAELNAKVASTQSNAYALDCALNEATRRNTQLNAVNQSNQNYIEELLLKLKLNNSNCNCSCCCCGGKYQQRQYTSFCNDSDCVGKNRSMISTTYEYDDMNVSVLKGGRCWNGVGSGNGSGDRKLNFDYDVDGVGCYGGYVYKKRYMDRDDNMNTINNNNNSYMNINMNNSAIHNNNNNVSGSCYYDNLHLPLESNRYKSVFGNKNYVPADMNNVGGGSGVMYEQPQKDIAGANVDQQQQHIKPEDDHDNNDNDNAKQNEHEQQQQQQQQDETLEHEDKPQQQQQQPEVNVDDDDVIRDTTSQTKINRVQKLVMEAFKDEDTVNKLKQKLGDDFESKLTNANIDEDYLDKIEQALIEINQETLDSNANNNNNNIVNSDKVSKRLLIAQNAKTKKQQFKSPPKDQMYYKAQLKKDITDKQYHYREYPRGWTSSKDYFVNNNTGDGKMERSTMKITNVMK